METVPLDSDHWTWDLEAFEATEHLGRTCVRVADGIGLVDGVELLDGVVELELAVTRERGFHGVVWRAAGTRDFESFYVRPHQVGNPDAAQYSPMFNGIGGFQLYHGEGYWAPISFPIDAWFRIRVVFAGPRAEIYVGDLDRPALEVAEQRRTPAAGRIGLLSSLAQVYVASFAYEAAAVPFRNPPPRAAAPVEDHIERWSVSDPFPERELGDTLDASGRTWTEVQSEPSGLVDLARLAGMSDGRNTVLARTTIESHGARTAELAFGFSDRVAVYLNSRLLYRGTDEYQSRDYRFLGSIGYFDRLYLPLVAGANELVLAVSEDFGGWGVQAKLGRSSG